ncbi:MAG: hypothetical protein AB7H96_11570 [Vicinamibacterales bacterium]
MSSSAPRRGRPRKFAQPSRPVTLTLPEETIASLGDVDPDLSRAIVRLVEPGAARRTHAPAELIEFGRRAVIVVTPTRTLEQRTGVVLVPLPDGRALISFDESMTPARLELTIQDALDEHDLPDEDSRVFESIRGLLRDARRSAAVTLRRQHIMVLEFQPQRREARVSQPTTGRRTQAD